MAKGLSRDVLARSALRIVDAEGLAALSMRRLATELEVDPMAPYKHVANKGALLDAVMDTILAGVRLDDLDGDPRARLRAGVHRVLTALASHPRAAGLFSARTWLSPHGLRIIDWGLGELADAGFDVRSATLAMNATGLFLTGLAQAISGGADPADGEALDVGSAAASPGAPTRFAEAVAAGHGRVRYEDVLDHWLTTLLDDRSAG